MPTPIWDKGPAAAGGAGGPADWVHRFTVGDDWRWDRRLLPYDVRGTRAHVWGLAQIGVFSADEHARLDAAFDALAAAVEAGTVTVTPDDEDAHTVIERWLTERLGALGKAIHAGRSRNDQVVAALRLFLRDALAARGRQVAALAEALCDQAEAHPRLLMPGYTHLQRAMPSSYGLWALGFAEVLASDLAGLRHAARQANVSPLGSAAGYGVPHLALPRRAVAARLGFRTVQTHATAVQLTRGKLELGVAHALAQVGLTVSRLAADLVLFATDEFGFVELPPAHTTGSSIMPQKRNPDVLELARATVHRLTQEVHLLATLPAGLPSGYHRDLQFTKAAVMRAVDVAGDLLAATTSAVEGLRPRPDRMRAACTPSLLATSQALARVRAGVPFRDAYRTAAADAAEGRLPPLDPDAVLDAYATDGTPGHLRPDVVREALAECADWLADV